MIDETTAAAGQDNTNPTPAVTPPADTAGTPAPVQSTTPSPEPTPASPAPATPTQDKPAEDVAQTAPAPLKTLMQEMADKEGAGTAPSDKTAGENTDGAGGAEPAKGYELSLPDGMEADPEAVAMLNEVGAANDLPPEAAQKLFEAATAYGQRIEQKIISEHQKGCEAVQRGWQDECRGDKAFGGAKLRDSLANIKNMVIRELGQDLGGRYLRDMDGYRMADHYPLFVLLNKLHAKTSELPSIVGNDTASREENTASVLFGDDIKLIDREEY